MKKIFYIAIAAAAIAAVSCARELEFNEAPENGSQALNITFSCGDMQTRATVNGENNENRVDRIDYFIFPYNADGKVAATDKWVYQDSIIVANADRLKLKYETTVETGVLSKIFPDGADKAVIFAVANYNGTTKLGTQETWADLHGLKVGQTFTKNGGKGFGLLYPRPMQTDTSALFFVMTADSVEVTLNKAGRYAVDAEVPLKRLASKVTVEFTYENCPETKQDGTKIMWVPQSTAGETRVYLSNAICNTTLGGPLSGVLNANDEDLAGRDIFEYAYDFLNNFGGEGQPAKPYYYTYPIKMEAGDDNQPYLKLVLPWYGYKYFGTETDPKFNVDDPKWRFYKQKEVYYKIVLPRKNLTESNCIYEYKVNVNIIGSDKEVNVTGQYVVKDWSNPDAVGASLATGRFISLDIPKEEYDMYTDEAQIVFVSSGDVTPIVEEIYQMNLTSATPTKDVFMLNNAVPASANQGGNNSLLKRKGISAEDIKGWVSIDGSSLKVTHEMDNRLLIDANNDGKVDDRNPAFDMSPYVFRIRLHLNAAGNDTKYDRTVTITQYPAMYVEYRRSAGLTFINGNSNKDAGVNVCYDDQRNHLGNLPNQAGTLKGTGSNDNPNNYIINVSILPYSNEDNQDVIGDARDPKINNLSDLGVTHYHPTMRKGSRYLISPKFIVASSYSALSTSPNYSVNLQTAEKRCAAYQENGYPAGRWRVPTAAEIMFLAKLSKFTFIPSLFNFTYTSAGYWSANGKVNGTGSGEPSLDTNDTTSGGGVRCVYDAWYWGEDPVDETLNSWKGFYDNK